MIIQKALQETGKARLSTWLDGAYVYLNDGVLYLKGMDTYNKPYASSAILRDDWQPHYEVKEIRPENEREVWINKAIHSVHVLITGWTELGGGKLVFRNADGDIVSIDPKAIHNKNGYTRIFPHVKDESIERIRIKDVTWHKGRGNGVSIVFPVADNSDEGSAEVDKDLLTRGPMTMILEMSKDKP